MKTTTIKCYAAIGKREDGSEFLLTSPRTMLPALHLTRPMMTGYASGTACKTLPVEVVIRRRRRKGAVKR